MKKYFVIERSDGKKYNIKNKTKWLIANDLFHLDRPLRNEGWVKDSSSGLNYKCEKEYVENLSGIDFEEVNIKNKTLISQKFLDDFNKQNKIIESDALQEELDNLPEIEVEEVIIKKRKYIPRIYKNENNVRLAVLSGDAHFLYQDVHAIDILEQVCEDYSEFIDEYIDGGDGVNNDTLSKWVSTEKLKHNLYEEMKAFEKHMWKLKSILPNSKFVVVEDNHYHKRISLFLAENPAMEGLLKEIDFPFDEQTPHGEPYFPFNQTRIGVIHGLVTSDNFTKGHSMLFKEDIINFHTHGSQHYTCKNGSKTLNKQPQKMWGMPSMCKQMAYMNGRPSRSNTGFGMLWYDLKNDNYTIQYIFVENKSAIYNGKIYTSRITEEG